MENLLFNADVWSAAVRIATPVTLAALGGLMCQKAGIFNIALEGMMLIGAFSAIGFVILFQGNTWLAMFASIFIVVLVSMIFGASIIRFKSNHIIASIAINLLSAGLTTFLLRAMFDMQGGLRPQVINKIPNLEIPILKDIPFIGQVLGTQHPVTYFAIFMVVVTAIILYKTPFGLAVMSLGENEDAARTAGIKPDRIKWAVIIWSGALCAIAGAYMSTGIVSEFSKNMIQGRGFTAFTAIVFGAANPLATWLVTLLFGFADAVGIRLELMGLGVSPSIIKMFPYILAIVALAISSSIRSNRHKRPKKMHLNNKKTQAANKDVEDLNNV